MRTGLLPTALWASFALFHAGCELVADFDDDKLNQGKTPGPMTIPNSDGAVAVMPDGSIRSDAAILRPNDAEAGDAGSDAAASDAEAPRDSGEPLDARVEVDAAEPDAAAADADAGTDASATDGSASDANAGDAGELLSDAEVADAAATGAGPGPDAGGLDAAR